MAKTKTINKTPIPAEHRAGFSPKVIAQIADEVAKTILNSIPLVPHTPRRNGKKAKKIENHFKKNKGDKKAEYSLRIIK